MKYDNNLILWVTIWMASFFAVILKDRKRGNQTSGLVIMFAIFFTLEYWVGAFIYVLPWYEGEGRYLTASGFIEATFGMMAFAVGNILLGPILDGNKTTEIKQQDPDKRLPVMYIAIGGAFYFLMGPIFGNIPSIRTFGSSGWNLICAGICLALYGNIKANKKRKIFFWILISALFPFLTVFGQGFLVFGAYFVIIIFSFFLKSAKSFWKLSLTALIFGYLGLSAYVNYMEHRGEIRRVVWNGGSGSEKREVLVQIADNFKLFDLHDQDHLWSIDIRMNLSELTGAAVENLRSGKKSFTYGATIERAFLGIIPRLIWPGKPMVLGGSATAAKYTGRTYAKGTSIAPGVVMELFIDFGRYGVVGGFLFLGVLLAFMDRKAGEKLKSGEWKGFILWFVPALSFLYINTLLQFTMTWAASFVFCVFVNKFVVPVFAGEKKEDS